MTYTQSFNHITVFSQDRWEVQQMKARLSVQQKHLDEEYKLQVQQVEREKEKLRLAQVFYCLNLFVV